MATKILCPHCTGRQWVTCEACEGNGLIETRTRISFMDGEEKRFIVCSRCHGDKTAPCSRCSGKGFL